MWTAILGVAGGDGAGTFRLSRFTMSICGGRNGRGGSGSGASGGGGRSLRGGGGLTFLPLPAPTPFWGDAH